jgi:lipooligosaccharide transport system permease protein
VKAGALLPGGPLRVLERNLLAYRRAKVIFAAGLLEPVLFLLSIGVGVGQLVGKVPGPGGGLVSYRDFVAPGLMATAAMNGAIFDTTFMFFIKLKYWGVFDSMLATPLGPGDVVTMVAMGISVSWLGILALPAAVLVCWAFAGAGAAGSSYMRSYFDFDFVNAVLIPSFLFSGVFFPLSRYPTWLAWVVRCTPLYQGVALIRDLTFGQFGASDVVHIAYLVALGALGLRIASRKIGRLLTP